MCSEQLWDKQYQITNQYIDRFSINLYFVALGVGVSVYGLHGLQYSLLYFMVDDGLWKSKYSIFLFHFGLIARKKWGNIKILEMKTQNV